MTSRITRRAGARPLVAFAALATLCASTDSLSAQESLSAAEQRLVARVDPGVEGAIALIEQTVNMNSGTLNRAGVRAVYDVMAPRFERLGFEVRWAELPDAMGRAGHLVAERRGDRGQSLLLIGHIDTVFEPDSPFQRYEREGNVARGPGVADMKGGNVVMLLALEALHAEGALDGSSITVVLTGDEEAPGQPLEVARRELREAGERADIALGFEPGSRVGGVDMGVVARRSSSSWRLEVEATSAHSSLVFRDEVGAGAIYEASRILSTLYSELRGEQYLTFNVGMILGGTEVEFDAARAGGTAEGKTNVVPGRVIATGDIRTMSDEQLQRVRERMRQVVALSLPGARASITFTDGYPSMPPSEANYALLARMDELNRALGYGHVEPFDPGARGAADIAFVSDLVDAGIDGLGPVGVGLHTVDEYIELDSVATAAKRAAVLIYRLTR